MQILGSRSLARETLTALGLDTRSRAERGRPSGHGPLARFLPRQTAVGPAPGRSTLSAEFLDRLSVKREGKSHVIALGWSSRDAAKAAAVANKLAELYMAGQLARKDVASRRQSGRFDEQLVTMKGRVAAAETALAEFRARSEAVRADSLGADPGEIAGLDGQLVVATVARAGREQLLERLRQLVESGEEAMPMGELGGSPMLDNLLALKAELLRREAEFAGQYGKRHPKIQAIRAEKAELDAAHRRGAQGRAAAVRGRGRPRARRRADPGRQARRAEGQGAAARGGRRPDGRAGARGRAQPPAVRILPARASTEERPLPAGAPDARLISEAVAPVTPSWPKPKLILSLTLTGGLLLGLAAMYLVETGQRGLRSEREVAEILGVPTLALVPRLEGPRRAGIAPQDYALDRPRSRYAEALREVLTGLILRRPDEAAAETRGRVVLVTSALPGEGKSTLTLSLARAAAAEGLRVMVVDADLRRPTLHELVGLKQGAGLVEVLRREVSLAEVLATDPRAPLKLLPGSKRMSQPTRLLGQDGIGALLTALRPAFDLILVDSAPLVAVVDAKLVAKLADSVLFLIRWGRTRRDFCELSLRGLRESGATIAGAVLTQVDLRRHARSGAGDAGFAYARLGEYYSD